MGGASRATVTRALSNWRKRGFIRTGQRRVTIIDPRGATFVAGTRLAWFAAVGSAFSVLMYG